MEISGLPLASGLLNCALHRGVSLQGHTAISMDLSIIFTNGVHSEIKNVVVKCMTHI